MVSFHKFISVPLHKFLTWIQVLGGVYGNCKELKCVYLQMNVLQDWSLLETNILNWILILQKSTLPPCVFQLQDAERQPQNFNSDFLESTQKLIHTVFQTLTVFCTALSCHVAVS